MYTFRAMGTDVAVTAPGADEGLLTSRIAAVFWRAEVRFSRFREDSELSRLNGARGPLAVSDEMFAALTRARDYHERTGGLFDPAVGASLLALGYDRPFSADLGRAPFRGEPATRSGHFSEVRLDPEHRTVDRPEHVVLDLGGMLKGSTVDLAAALLPDVGALDAGGDAVLRGPGPDGTGWLVDVEDPGDPTRTVATLRVTDRAVATSAPNRRTWRLGDRAVHHLIDPRTGAPAVTDLLQTTIVAPHAELADILAKTTFLLGAGPAARFLEDWPGVGAVLVREAHPPLFLGDLDLAEAPDA